MDFNYGWMTKGLEKQFTNSGGKFYFVELSANLKNRMERNLTPHRMERKASKRDVKWSERNLLRDTERHQLNTKMVKYYLKTILKLIIHIFCRMKWQIW